VITPGTHLGKCVDHGVKVLDDGRMIIELRFSFDEDPEVTMIKALWPLSGEKGAKSARISLKALGFDPDAQSVSELDENRTLLAGRPASLVIEMDDRRDDGSLKIAWVNAIHKPAGKDGISKINAALRGAKSKGKTKPGPMEAIGSKDQEPPWPVDEKGGNPLDPVEEEDPLAKRK
jgi:hypothetical protein